MKIKKAPEKKYQISLNLEDFEGPISAKAERKLWLFLEPDFLVIKYEFVGYYTDIN